MNPWNDPCILLPSDGDVVWCRFNTFYSNPILAKWQNGSADWLIDNISKTIPWYYCVRWKSQ
jgi:hypothetical protein